MEHASTVNHRKEKREAASGNRSIGSIRAHVCSAWGKRKQGSLLYVSRKAQRSAPLRSLLAPLPPSWSSLSPPTSSSFLRSPVTPPAPPLPRAGEWREGNSQ